MTSQLDDQFLNISLKFLTDQYLHFIDKGTPDTRPFFAGVSGPQGSGKTTLVSKLRDTLQQEDIITITISIDDFYLPLEDLETLRKDHPDNPMLSTRGVPGTHDITLAKSVLANLEDSKSVDIPAYDKAAFNGRGDRVAKEEWASYNQIGERKVQVVILEGWCWGFRSLGVEQLTQSWEHHRTRPLGESKTARQELSNLLWVDNELEKYWTGFFDKVDTLIILEAERLDHVYTWRLETEHRLRDQRGESMSDIEVRAFVDNYMPCYELYKDSLRDDGNGIRNDKQKDRQLWVSMDLDRRVQRTRPTASRISRIFDQPS
ncbi:MAG: hypothetical protein M1814_001133 [Vezdaea aestivalis]|nr:MAG: hypothetical protein M1814_001133 [Vezdaea aestivalis]